MRISFNQTTGPNVRNDNGYGHAAEQCKKALKTLGHEVTWRDETGARSEIIRFLPGRYQVVLGETECRKAFPVDVNLKGESCRVIGSGS